MENKIRSFLKRYILVIWIVIVCIALSYMAVSAFYPTRQNRAKKVVSLQSEADIQFSSNLLEEKTFYKTSVINDGTPVTVDIRNYSKTNSTKWYSSDISYTLTAELTDASGTRITDSSLIGSGIVRICAVTETTVNDVTQETETTLFTLNSNHVSDSQSQTLAHSADASTVQSYRVYFPSASTKVCVRLTAVPAASHNDLRTISAILSVSDKSNVQSNGWTGSFNDPTTVSPAAYDAFNYTITGHGNSSSAVIRWNADVLTLNKMYISKNFNKDISAASTDDEWRQLSALSISDESNHGQYAFQVFKAGSGFDDFIAAKRAAWETAMEGIDPTDADYITETQYLWNELQKCIVFDDGI